MDEVDDDDAAAAAPLESSCHVLHERIEEKREDGRVMSGMRKLHTWYK